MGGIDFWWGDKSLVRVESTGGNFSWWVGGMSKFFAGGGKLNAGKDINEIKEELKELQLLKKNISHKTTLPLEPLPLKNK